ncbi:L7Ae/L30e/S12e/Gadd45 family ribosomal protein [Lentibacillus halophilus]|uniref:L7Ae/L30e/S12e/Gadd45 family ribosomal protein n=1 Tax=Lentibacillus halophilus TaxID=295065 RepID=A0ABN0ZEG0_9BACI
MKNNYLSIIGLAYRAGKCSLGEDIIVNDIRKNRAKLVLLADDIGTRTRKKLINKCETYDVPFVFVEDRETLSNAIGKTQRVAAAILDDGFATKIQSLLR